MKVSFAKLAITGFFVYMAFQIMPLIKYLSLYAYVGSNIDRSVQSLSEYAEITMGDYRMRIPKPYLYNKDELNGCEHQTVSMYALLPDISPRTSANKEQVNFGFFPTGKNVVNFNLTHITSSAKSGEELLAYLKSTRLSDLNDLGEVNEYGLVTYRSKRQKEADDIFSYKYDDKDFFIADCTQIRPWAKSNARSTCSVDNYVTKGLYLSYKFDRNHLKYWKAIDLNMKNFIRSLILEKKRD